MPSRVSPTDRVRSHIDELFAEGRPLPEILEEVARLGAQLLMQAALEAEVTEFLGRGRYQRAAACEDMRPGARNGYRDVTVKTTAGPVTLSRPKLRGTTEAFASRLFGSHVTKTNALESLVIASFVRGLSVRDVEAALAEALGDQAAISKSTVSSVCQQIKDEYQAWARRPLDQVSLDYLFLDASFFRMHPGSPAEPVLAAWGITTEGKARVHRPGPGHRRVRRRLGQLPARSQRPGPGQPAADHLRRRARADLRDRAGLPEGAAPAVPDPSRQKYPGQDPGRDAGRGQGRLLGHLRHRRPQDTARPPAHRDHRRPHQARWPPGSGPTYPARR